MELGAFRASLDAWLDSRRDQLAPGYAGAGTLDQKMAQIARVRRETGSRVTFITVNPDRCQRRACLVAPQLPGV